MVNEPTPTDSVNNGAVNSMDRDSAAKAFASGDLRMALPMFRKIAESCPAALVDIGVIYELGRGGIERDYHAAREWYERSVREIDDPAAHLRLAMLYLHGLGVDADYDAVRYHLSRIEDQDEPEVQYARGLIAQFGLGRDVDIQEAEACYRKAMADEHMLAVRQLGVLSLGKGKVFQGLRLLLRCGFLVYRVMLMHGFRAGWASWCEVLSKRP